MTGAPYFITPKAGRSSRTRSRWRLRPSAGAANMPRQPTGVSGTRQAYCRADVAIPGHRGRPRNRNRPSGTCPFLRHLDRIAAAACLRAAEVANAVVGRNTPQTCSIRLENKGCRGFRRWPDFWQHALPPHCRIAEREQLRGKLAEAGPLARSANLAKDDLYPSVLRVAHPGSGRHQQMRVAVAVHLDRIPRDPIPLQLVGDRLGSAY